MPQEQRNRFTDWFELLTKQAPIALETLKEWGGAVREQPALLWETRAVRYAVYGIGLLILVWGAKTAGSMLTPAPPASATATATSADYHVACIEEACGHHFVTHREFGFDDFPLVCPRCGRKTGMPARPCNSPTCRSRWIVPIQSNGILQCPFCGGRFN